ncbi:MAG: NAD(P)-dependent oxidoreductase [Chloroflexi bacterium]|nr:NAD(P)-dependent oxidoreductase [Chloroflexota bacterium]
MRVLVTGAGGFVGGFVAARFARAGHAVVGLDRQPRPLDARHGAGAIPMIEVDLLDEKRILAAVHESEAETIVHAAAVISQADGAADPTRTVRINVEGTLHVLEAARARGARVVYVSTATLYGLHPDLHPLDEDDRPEPVGIYDASKLMAETLALTYATVYGLDVVAIRPGFVYGPGASTGGYYLDRAFRGEPIDEPVGGDLPMDMTYVRDLAEGIYLAATVRPLAHRLFNITGGASRRRAEVAALVQQLVPRAAIRVGPGIAPGAHLRGPSRLDRARADLGYAPRFTLEAGLTDWLDWLRAPVG